MLVADLPILDKCCKCTMPLNRSQCLFKMQRVRKFGVMVPNMKVTGGMAWQRVREPFIMQMEIFKLLNTIKIK